MKLKDLIAKLQDLETKGFSEHEVGFYDNSDEGGVIDEVAFVFENLNDDPENLETCVVSFWTPNSY